MLLEGFFLEVLHAPKPFARVRRLGVAKLDEEHRGGKEMPSGHALERANPSLAAE